MRAGRQVYGPPGAGADVGLGQRREVLLEDLAVFGILDLGELGDGAGLPFVAAGQISGDGARPGHGLVRGSELPVLAAVTRLVELDAAPGVVERGLAAAENGIAPGNLPLPAGEIDVLADLTPVIARGMSGMEHLVVLLA